MARKAFDVYVTFDAEVKLTVIAEDDEEALTVGEEEFFQKLGLMKILKVNVENVVVEEED